MGLAECKGSCAATLVHAEVAGSCAWCWSSRGFCRGKDWCFGTGGGSQRVSSLLPSLL